MKKISYHITRLGLGITFVWIGALIFKDPQGWGSFIQPWAADLMPFPVVPAMILTAALNVVTGMLLLLDVYVWFFASFGALQVLGVLVVSGITDITVRDIAILGCSLALAIEKLPESIASRFSFLR